MKLMLWRSHLLLAQQILLFSFSFACLLVDMSQSTTRYSVRNSEFYSVPKCINLASLRAASFVAEEVEIIIFFFLWGKGFGIQKIWRPHMKFEIWVCFSRAGCGVLSAERHSMDSHCQIKSWNERLTRYWYTRKSRSRSSECNVVWRTKYTKEERVTLVQLWTSYVNLFVELWMKRVRSLWDALSKRRC